MLKGGSVLKSLVKALGLVAGLALSGTVAAVGMGSINVTTALGEPLKAEVALVAVGKGEISSLSAHLASPDVFKGAGMDYPYGLPQFTFHIKTRANGEPYIVVTSEQPLNEPFVSLLVELTWSSGRLLREYTFLLDPPGFKAEQPKAAEVKPVLSQVEGRPEATVVPSAEPTAAVVTSETKAAVTSESKPAQVTVPMAVKIPAATKKTSDSAHVASGQISVKRGDTLSKIALQAKSPDISLERMLVALYRANADAFEGKNMNRLKTGKILRMPQEADLNNVAQAEAVKEMHAQTVDWHAYRQKLAAASGAVTEQAPRQEAGGKISAKVAEAAAPAKETAKEVVRLSKGEAPGDKATAGGKAKSAQDKQHAMEEDAIAKSNAQKESKERVAMLEKNVQAMQRLVELKAQLAAQSKPAPSKVEAPVPSKVPVVAEPAKVEVKAQSSVAPVPVFQQLGVPVASATSAVACASAVKPAKPAAKSFFVKPSTPPPPTMLDQVLSEPLYLAGGAAALLGLGGLALARRRKAGKEIGGSVEQDADAASARITAPIAPSPETGDFTQVVAAAPAAVSQPEDVDPISEADLFLNFGRDAQAEEILKDALNRHPENQQIRLKLLSIYAKRKDATTFAGVAHEVQDSGDAAAWALAAEMGRKLEPNNPMYGVGESESVEAAPSDEVVSEAPAADLDFDLGAVAAEEVAVENFDRTVVLSEPQIEKAADEIALDFDLGMDVPVEAAAAGHESTIVLDEPLGEETAATTGLDFDLGMFIDEQAETPPAAEPAAEKSAPAPDVIASEMSMSAPELSGTTDFMLDMDTIPQPSAQAQPDEPASNQSASNLDDLIFDVTSTEPAVAAMTEKKKEGTAAENTDDLIEFTLDFPVEETPLVSDHAAPALAADVISLSDINLNLDSPAPVATPAAETKNALWHDVATKLDLARAYQEMGDNPGAREILDEVLQDGDEQQRASAEAMLKQLT